MHEIGTFFKPRKAKPEQNELKEKAKSSE